MIRREAGWTMPIKEQAVLWRAAARGHEVNGNHAEANRCWNQARLILGLPPRKRVAA